MEGRHPRSGRWLREGANGARGGGIDLTFSAPKSVSAVWALGDESQRREIEAAHAAAVSETIALPDRDVADHTPPLRRAGVRGARAGPRCRRVPAHHRPRRHRGQTRPTRSCTATWSITSAVRDDGRIVAVASRPIFRSARELGAYYRCALAHQLQQRGYAIEQGTGKHGRYFEIAGIPRGLLDAFSSRSREVARAAERFRAQWGRAPERGELRQLKLENRKAKVLITRADLQQSLGRNRRTLRLRRPPGQPCARRCRRTRAGGYARGSRRAAPDRASRDVRAQRVPRSPARAVHRRALTTRRPRRAHGR